jgi:hypothetical protein
MSNPTLQAHAIEYASLSRISLDLKTPLGYGNDGTVWRSHRQSAVKAFEREHNYRMESECYQRFAENNVKSLHGLTIPQLMGLNDSLMIVEMRLVTPPFLLDFGKAHLDSPPDFSAEVWEDWEHDGQELFAARWPDVKTVIAALKRYGIYYYDAKPGNINFGDDDAL